MHQQRIYAIMTCQVNRRCKTYNSYGTWFCTYASVAVFPVAYPYRNCPAIARAAELKLETS